MPYEHDLTGMFVPVLALDPTVWSIGAPGNGERATNQPVGAPPESGDAVAGRIIDRLGYNTGMLLVAIYGTLTPEKTATVEVTIKDSGDGLTFATYYTADAYVLPASPDANAVFQVPLNFEGANALVQATIEVTLSATTTDTATAVAILVLGGARNYPIDDVPVSTVPLPPGP